MVASQIVELARGRRRRRRKRKRERRRKRRKRRSKMRRSERRSKRRRKVRKLTIILQPYLILVGKEKSVCGGK